MNHREENGRGKMIMEFFQKHNELVLATASIFIGVAYMVFGRETLTVEDLQNWWPTIQDWSVKLAEEVAAFFSELVR